MTGQVRRHGERIRPCEWKCQDASQELTSWFRLFRLKWNSCKSSIFKKKRNTWSTLPLSGSALYGILKPYSNPKPCMDPPGSAWGSTHSDASLSPSPPPPLLFLFTLLSLSALLLPFPLFCGRLCHTLLDTLPPCFYLVVGTGARTHQSEDAGLSGLSF